MVTADGGRVEPGLVQLSSSGPPRQVLRIKHGPYFIADCTTVTELA
jgi:hypothetical protein